MRGVVWQGVSRCRPLGRFPSIFLWGVVCPVGVPKCGFWVLIVSMHSADSMGFLCGFFRFSSGVGQGEVISLGIVSSSRSFVVYLSVGCVLSVVGIGGGIRNHGFGF